MKPADPKTPHHALIERACALMANSAEALTLAELGAALSLSPSHLQRVFKAATGVSPKAYQQALRQRRLDEALPAAASVTEALYAAGYGSASRFYDSPEARRGMRPSEHRRGGAGLTVWHAVVPCDLGWLLVARTERGVCALELGDSQAALQQRLRSRYPHAHLEPADAALQRELAQVLAHLQQPHSLLALPLDVQGTVFQRRVWEALRQIPLGQTASYTDIAQRLGQPRAVRAVAGACVANPVALLIPCHRVLRADGALSGYRWGVERKAALLARERSAASDSDSEGPAPRHAAPSARRTP